MNLKSLFPHGSKTFIGLNPEIQCSQPEQDQTPALGAAVQGETESLQRVTVRFTGYRCRPLDPDNFSGGCKDLLDGLRHSGILSGDEPWRINFETRQEKARHKSEEKTVIEIENYEIKQ